MTPRLDLYASQPHYADHLAPIWAALPDELRGDAWVVDADTGEHLAAPYRLHDYWPRMLPAGDRPVMVAAYRDLELTMMRPPAVFVEHGIGQTYRSANGYRHPGYPGGAERDHVGLFICPNEAVAAANLAAYPDAGCAIVGSPHVAHLARLAQGPISPPERSAAFTFHWDCNVAPETRSTLNYWAPWLAGVPRALPDWRFYGHRHPLLPHSVAFVYQGARMPFIDRLEAVLDRAMVLVADNSSVIYEWAALGRPVVLLNAPTYRRDVDHGLRFWEYADIGPQVDDPEALPAAIVDALSPRWRYRRREVTDALFGRHGDPVAETVEAVSSYLATVSV